MIRASAKRILVILAALLSLAAADPAQPSARPSTPVATISAQPAHTVTSARHDLLTAVLHRDMHAMASATVSLVDAETAKHLDPHIAEKLNDALARPIPGDARDRFLEQPTFIPLNPNHFTGNPIYFINGIATTSEAAQSDAADLSRQLHRPVLLLYNPTAIRGNTDIQRDLGIATDLAHCIDERTWPFRNAQSQDDATTRQLTWLFTQAPGPITVVSHSQGCLIVRNALLAAARLQLSNPQKPAASVAALTDRVTWIATGVPLRDQEILPRPKRLQIIANPADPVAQTVGLRLDPTEFTRQRLETHYFGSYLPQIDPANLP